MNVHCLFEQSGTFKNEFKKLGYNAYDYDILNDYGETDFQIDLFNEIDKAYESQPSIFDNFMSDDLIMAFFPCTRFESQILLFFRGDAYQQKNYSATKKIKYAMKLHDELHKLYCLIGKLFIICMENNYRLILENPYSEQHYLRRYFPIKPVLIDNNRMERGDYFKKPTQYWFINCEPQNNIIHDEVIIKEQRKINDVPGSGHVRARNRSEISSDYAKRFIQEFIEVAK